MTKIFFRSAFRHGRRIDRLGMWLYLALLTVLLVSIFQGFRGIG